MAKSFQTTEPVLTQGLAPVFTDPETGIIKQLRDAQNTLPTLSGLAGEIPTLGIPGLTPEELQLIAQLEGAGANSPDLASARGELSALTSGDIGSSPATQAGMKAFNELVAPQIMQDQALQGTASGGAALEALSKGATAAAVPLIGQENQAREAAISQYGNLATQQVAQIAAALEAAGMPREVAAAQAKAQYDELIKKFQYESGIQTMPLEMLPLLFGSRTESHTTPGAWDYVSGALSGLTGGSGGGSGGGGGGGGIGAILSAFR